MKTLSALICAALLAGCASTGPSPEAKTQLAPTGELRVAVLTSNPIIHRTTPALGRELAAHAGVPAKLIDYGAVNKLMEDAAKGAWDVAVVAIDPERRSLVDFAPAHLNAEGFLTVLVPPGSRLLDDSFAGLHLAFTLPKNRPAAARYVAQFVEQSKANGAVQRAVDAAGLQSEVSVAPPEQESTYKGM
jgi:hypothetical protein